MNRYLPLFFALLCAFAADAAPDRSGVQRLLKEGRSEAVRALPAGEREILLAKLALDANCNEEALRLLAAPQLTGNDLAAALKAEAFRRQSVAAAVRAGDYANSVAADIDRLKSTPLTAALNEAENRLQTFMRSLGRKAMTEPGGRVAAASALPDGVQEALQSWLADWQSRDGERYLSHYHPEFTSGDHNLASWSEYKRRVNGSKSFIRVDLSELRLVRGPESSAAGEGVLLAFRQHYQSNNFAASSRKQLYLVRQKAGEPWLILFEGDAGESFSPR